MTREELEREALARMPVDMVYDFWDMVDEVTDEELIAIIKGEV